MKITYSSENINSFGGINFADHIVRGVFIYEPIDKTLDGSALNAEYSNSDLFRSHLLMLLCDG